MEVSFLEIDILSSSNSFDQVLQQLHLLYPPVLTTLTTFLITIMLLSTPSFMITFLLSLFQHAVLASPVPEPMPSPGPDQNPTIWSHSTIDSMKASRELLYQYALTVYHQQKRLENPVNCFISSGPNINYTVGTDCPFANQVNRNSFC